MTALVTLVSPRPFLQIDAVMVDFKHFIEEDGQNFTRFFTQHQLLSAEDLKTIFEGIRGVMRLVYDRLADFENLVIPLDAAFAMLEVVAEFLDGLIDMIENLPSYDPESPLSAFYQITDQIDALIPDDFKAQELVEKLNILPNTEELTRLRRSLLLIIGVEGIPPETIPPDLSSVVGCIPELIDALD